VAPAPAGQVPITMARGAELRALGALEDEAETIRTLEQERVTVTLQDGPLGI
jgi:hypothetical protein